MARTTVTARASAALPAAGAYDSAPTTVTALVQVHNHARRCELYVTYTLGANGANGQAKFKVQASADGVTWYDRTVKNAAIVPSGSENVGYLYVDASALPIVASGSITKSYTIDVSTAPYFRVAFAEVGDLTHPGTVAATAVLSD